MTLNSIQNKSAFDSHEFYFSGLKIRMALTFNVKEAGRFIRRVSFVRQCEHIRQDHGSSGISILSLSSS